jgi:hypothetical protein
VWTLYTIWNKKYEYKPTLKEILNLILIVHLVLKVIKTIPKEYWTEYYSNFNARGISTAEGKGEATVISIVMCCAVLCFISSNIYHNTVQLGGVELSKCISTAWLVFT